MKFLHGKNKIVLCLILIICLLAQGSANQPAAAQTTASASIIPAIGYLNLMANNSITLQVFLADVVNLQAFDVTITYDSSIVTLTSWQIGAIMEPFFQTYLRDDPGFFRFAGTKMGPPSFSGSGILFSVTFQGVAPGTSPVMLADVQLSTPGGVRIPVQKQNGQLEVGAYYPVYGSFGLEGRVNRGGIPVTLGVGAVFGLGPYTGKTLDQLGVNLTLNQVMADTYTVTTAQPRCLNVTAELNKTIHMTGAYTMQPLTLHCGNALWSDNIINVSDVGIVGGQWGMSQADLPPGETLNGDVNFDDIVNIRDLALVAGNYGLSSADVYTAWTP